MHLLKKSWHILSLFIVSLFIYGFLATPYAVKTLLGYAEQQGINLKTTGVSGSLLYGIKFNTLYYEDEEIIVDATQAVVPLKLLPLFWSRIELADVTADTLHLILKDPNPFQNIAPLIRWSRNHPIDLKLSFYNVDIQHTTLQIVPNAPITDLGHVQLDAYTKRNEFHIERLSMSTPFYKVDAQGLLDQANTPELTITGDWQLYTDIPLAGHLKAIGTLEQLQITQQFTTPINSTATGKLYDLDTKPAWKLSMPYNAQFSTAALKAEKFPFQFIDNSTPLSENTGTNEVPDWTINGTLNLQGALRETQEFTSQLQIGGPLSKNTFAGEMNASYDFENWELQKLQLIDNAYNGLFSLKGQYITSSDKLTLTGNAEKLRWPLTDEPFYSIPTASWQFEKLNDQYQLKGNTLFKIQDGKPAIWEFDVAKNEQQWQIKQLTAKWPSGLLTLTGLINSAKPEQTKLQWNLDVKQLADIFPQGTGIVHSKGQLAGDLSKPTINASLDAIKLAYKNYPLDALHFAITGTLDKHQAKLSLQQRQKEYQLAVTGKLDKTLDWQGTLQNATIHLNRHQTFTLRTPTPLQWNKTQYGLLAPLCLQQGATSVCFNGKKSDAQGWNIAVDATKFPLRSLFSLINYKSTHQFVPTGIMNLHLTLSRDVQQKLAGAFDLELPAGSISMDNKKIAYQGGQAKATIAAGQLTGSLYFNLWENSFISGNINMPDLGKNNLVDFSKQKINASLQAKLISPEIFELFAPEITDLQGPINAKINIGNTISNPSIQADITWDKGKIDIPRLGITLNDIYLTAKSDAQGALHINSSLSTDTGKLYLKGKSERWQNNWQTELVVTGKNATLMDTSKYHVVVTPDLQFTLLGKALTMEGTIDVPEAMLKPRNNENVIQPSEDIIVVSAKQAAPFVSPVAVSSNILLRLGNNVSFDSYSFKSLIRGQLHINHEPNKLARATGELTLINGQYMIYGKKLDIKKGRLLFAGTELYNPMLDITAEREVNIIQTRTSQLRLLDVVSPATNDQGEPIGDQDVVDGVVGIRVGGLLDEPNISLYSNPWLPETERLSYLVLGVPSDNASSAQGQILAGAFQELADSLGFTQEESILTGVGNIAGLDNFNVESSTQLNKETGTLEQQTSVVIGKQLTEDLSLDYSVGLLDPTNVVHLRYRLNENWALQTEADNQGQGGGDLIFSFER